MCKILETSFLYFLKTLRINGCMFVRYMNNLGLSMWFQGISD